MRALCMGILLLLTVPVSADPFASQYRTQQLAEYQAVPQGILPRKSKSRVGNQMAATRAKQQYPNSKILSVREIRGENAYQVKLLSRDGVMKYVYVDASSGEVVQ